MQWLSANPPSAEWVAFIICAYLAFRFLDKRITKIISELGDISHYGSAVTQNQERLYNEWTLDIKKIEDGVNMLYEIKEAIRDLVREQEQIQEVLKKISLKT